jgi:putative transcriptional regulator
MRPTRLILTAMLGLLTWVSAPAQLPAKGMLLVATEELRDPVFSETVLLLLHYGSEGAIAVAINRPTWVRPEHAFPDLEYLQEYRGNIYFGGPVARANILVLVKNPGSEALESEPVLEDVYVSADPEFLRRAVAGANDERSLRLYAGHASWEAGQLDREIAAGSWRVTAASGAHVFSSEPLELWRQLLTPASEMVVRLRHAEAAMSLGR